VKKQTLENLPKLFIDENKDEIDRQAKHERQINELYNEIGRLNTQPIWLKNNPATMSRIDRLAMLEPHSSELSFEVQSELFGLRHSSLYNHPLLPSTWKVATKYHIDEIYAHWLFYGSRRVTVVLNQERITISRPTVQSVNIP
jgi:hypothetical protein